MSDPYAGMISFQECVREKSLKIAPVTGYVNLYSYADMPEPDERRLTYVRLDDEQEVVKAFLSCVLNGHLDGRLVVAVGYAVPENYRNLGYAKSLLRDVIQDLLQQASKNGLQGLVIEAVVDKLNLASQKVAGVVLNVEPELILDSHTRKPALRYTAVFDFR